MKHAKKSLQELAVELVEDAFERASGPNPRVLWWDDGGYLETVIDDACSEIGIDVTKADGNPLMLRQHALTEGDGSVLWYVSEGREGRDWFRDVRETGGEIECSVEELAAQAYGANPWDIPDPGEAEEDRDELAKVLLEELTRPTRRPTLQELQDILLLGGHGDPVRRVLQGGWSPEDAGTGSVDALRDRLEEEGVPGLEPSDDGHGIVEKVRRWAVAQSLIGAGVPKDAFPAPYDRQPSLHGRGAHRALTDVLKERPGEQAEVYLSSFWESAVNRVDDPWSVADCPVDGALENRLWSEWLSDWDDEDYDACLERAERRARVLGEAYGEGRTDRDGSPWFRAWRQAEALADLASRLDTWNDGLDETPIHKLYGDEEDGTWRIDRAVRELIVSGSPEQNLPETHPGKASIGDIRSELVDQRYIDYLERLAEETTAQIRTGQVVDSVLPVSRFWAKHREDFAKGPETVVFYIDALRLDLAYELAEKLRDKDLQVKSTLWAGVLPSETEFGMAALTPGDPHTFEVDLVDGKLRALRNRRKVNTTVRKDLLEKDGWSIAKDEINGWEKPRVAYFDTELDDIGENDLGKLEQTLAGRVDKLADFIADQIERGKWARSFVVADHGFALLPRGTGIEKITPPDGASDVKRRRIAGKDLNECDAGILIDGNSPLTGHLSTPVRVLVNPLQRFRKQAVTNDRFYHGGALPQEFILNFLKIDRM